MSGFIFDGAVGTLGSLDGLPALAIVLASDYVPSTAHANVDDVVAHELGREAVTLEVTNVAGVVTVQFAADPEVAITDTSVAGWVVALDSGSDATSELIVWNADFGGIAPDPYVITCPDGIARAERG